MDHPEHFDDEIREYKESGRYIPTLLMNLLFEYAEHRCTICKAPWLEIHHIDARGEGGKTEYDNLIVLCPNCHTRVHQCGVPTKQELKDYKLKQKIGYGLPVLSRLTDSEQTLIQQLASLPADEQVFFSQRYHKDIEEKSQEIAIVKYRQELGLVHLQDSGLLTVEQGLCVTLAEGEKVSVNLIAKFTSKGLKWVRYLCSTQRIQLLRSKQ